MLASIQKVESGYVARFDRLLNHSVEKVWAALTENAFGVNASSPN
jgi:uncharacterized protein YndB with AHSA1/START domain